MTRDTIDYRDKGRAVFLAAIMVLSVVAMSAAFVGATAALNADTATADADPSDRLETATHTINVDTDEEEQNEDVQGIVVDYEDPGVDLEGVDENDVTVTIEGHEDDVAAVEVLPNPQVNIELENSLDDADVGTDIEVVIEGVGNPNGDSDVDVTTHDTDFGVGDEDNSENAVGSATALLEVTGPFYAVSNFNSTTIAEPGGAVEGDALITNDGDDNETQSIEYLLWSEQDGDPDEFVQSIDDAEVDLQPGEDTEVEFAGTIDDDIEPGDYIISAISDNDAEILPFTVADPDDRAFITGDLRDQDNDRINNATDVPVRILDEDTGQEIAASPIFVDEPDDDYTQEVPVEPGGTNYTVFVDPDEAEAATGEEFESFARSEQVAPSSTERFDIRLVRLVVPAEINVDPQSEQVFADGEDSATFTVTVTGDDGEPFEDADVEVTDDGDSVLLDGFDTQTLIRTTDEDGQFELEVSSDVVQTGVELAFEEQSQELETTATVDFILDGEGEVIGDVWSQTADAGDDRRSLEGAQVWTFQKSLYEENSIEAPTPEDAGDYWYYRVVDNETGEILDVNQDYRIDNDFQSDELKLTKTTFLNETDRSLGSGFAVENNVDGTGPVFVTPLEPGEYRIEVSETAPHASDNRIGFETDPQEEFQDNPGAADAYLDDTVLVAPTERGNNLTFEAAKERTDGPGDARHHDYADDQGKYALNNLFADYQAGVDYTVAATAAGYDIQFVDPLVTEDGAFFEDGEDENFALDPVPITPDDVDITNVGIHPALEEGEEPDFSLVESFENMTDEYSQVIPRDGSVDVLHVETSGEGTPLNATVDLQVPDDGDREALVDGELRNSTAEVIGVFGGDTVISSNSDLGQIHTGDDFSVPESVQGVGPIGEELGEGEALVLIESDESGETLTRSDEFNQNDDFAPKSNKTGIWAQLTADQTAHDFSDKTFQGVFVFDAGSISGTISNEDTLLPNTVVWTEEFWAGQTTRFDVQPVDDDAMDDLAENPAVANDQIDEMEFTIEVVDVEFTSGQITDETIIESVNVTGEDLKSFNLGANLDTVSEESVDTFNLLRSQSEHSDGEYSMDRVPASDTLISPFQPVAGSPGVDYTRLTGVQYGTAESGAGTSANPVQPGFTQEGNVVITGVEPIEVPDEWYDEYTEADGSVETSGLLDAISDWQNNQLDTTDLLTLIESWQTGEPVEGLL